MTPKTKKIIFLSTLAAFLLVGTFADAAIVNCGGTSNHSNACTIGDLIDTVVAIINLLLSWAWLVSMLFIIWGGWQMVSSGGNDEQIAAGKTIFSQALIGFFLIMVSYVLINFVVSILSGSGVPRSEAWLKAFKLLP